MKRDQDFQAQGARGSFQTRPHSLTGELRGFHSIMVNGNWRVIFRFVGQDIELVDYLDYQ